MGNDIENENRRNFLRKIGIAGITTAFALALAKTGLAQTVITDEYVESGTLKGAYDADTHALSNVSNSNVKAAAAIDESKLNLDFSTNGLNNRATAIENDIDYPTAVKQKAIVDTGEDGGVEGGVLNGGFEDGIGTVTDDGWIGAEKYGWYADRDATAISITYENGKLKISNTDGTGSSSVKNVPGVTLPELSKHAIRLIPSTKYRVSCEFETVNVAADAAFLSMIQYDSAAVVGTTSTLTKATGDTDKTYYEAIITTDADAVFAVIEAHNDVAGNVSSVSFYNIKLEQIDTQTVNTQVDEIVSVSVEGVTTTDNIDQLLETSGQTYALTTAVNEGSTHKQTFTPTADRGDGKHLLTKIQVDVAAVGTGDWTIEVHNAANAVLASKTIVNGSMSTGDIDFDTPTILDVGTAYHFHAYSTIADGTVTTTTSNDFETVDYHAQFAKHTESPVISANGGSLDMNGVKLLTGATITVNSDGSGKYVWATDFSSYELIAKFFDDTLSSTSGGRTGNVSNGWLLNIPANRIEGINDSNAKEIVIKYDFLYPSYNMNIYLFAKLRYGIDISKDGTTWDVLLPQITTASDTQYNLPYNAEGSTEIYIKFHADTITDFCVLNALSIIADLDCQTALPIFTPSTEVTTETSDLVLNPIDISEDGYWKLNSDLTGWESRTFSMLASEAAFESQAVSANTIYMYDSNGTTPWTWDERNGLVPPADRIAGTVTAKFLVGDNQIRSSVNGGSMKANVNLSWNEESLRAALNRLTALANLQYPIVIEVEDVPAIDIQNEPTGASAETGYTNDVTSLRQTTAGVAAIVYTGLLPRENQFSEWLDITVVCSDGDGTLQGKLYTVGGVLVETYADLETNPVIEISNPDYKYSRERLILQISASAETTSTAWAVTDIKWRYQYNG